ncbi:hypothetical protein [Shewanella glacialipiscicola]|uniref:hypothetical protein n=1 Tax=Shewanella glacialipiscicola TaxID=614069 RepID=UPI003D7C11C0
MSSNPETIKFIFSVKGSIAIFRISGSKVWEVPSVSIDPEQLPEAAVYELLASVDCESHYAYNETELHGVTYTTIHLEDIGQITMPEHYDAVVLLSPSMLIDALVDNTQFIDLHVIAYLIYAHSFVWPIPFDFGLAKLNYGIDRNKRYAMVMSNGREMFRVYENDHFFRTLTVDDFNQNYSIIMRNR